MNDRNRLLKTNEEEAQLKLDNDEFSPDHNSFYSNQDIAMLNKNRTIAPSGCLREPCSERLIESAFGKAYSAAFSCIKEIPIFTEFDIWKN